jgi:hypothetical protein
MFSRTVTAAVLFSTATIFSTAGWAQDDKAPTPASYSEDTPIETLAANPAAAAILNKDLPGLLSDAQYPMFKRMSLKSLQAASGGDLSKDDVNKTVADLQALPTH